MRKSKLPIVSLLAITVIMLISLLVLIGWFVHSDLLMSVIAGQVKMQFNTALCFIFSCIVLLLNHTNKGKALSVILSAIICLTGLLTLSEYIFSVNIGIDELFISDDQLTTSVYYAGRMSPLTAINFIFIGPGLQLLNKEKTASYQFTYLSVIAFTALLMLISFNFIADIPTYFRIAIHVVLGFILLCGAIWYAQPMLRNKISFEGKLFTGFATVIILMIVLGVFSSYYNNKRTSTARLVNHTNQVLRETQEILSVSKDFESGSRGYVLTGDSTYLEHFIIAKNTVFGKVNDLKKLTSDNRSQQNRLDSLLFYIQKRMGFSEQLISLRNEKGITAAIELVATKRGIFYMNKIRGLIDDIQEEERALLVTRQSENDKSITAFNRAFVFLLVSVLVLLMIISYAIRNNINSRKRAEEELSVLNTALEQKVKYRTEAFRQSEAQYRHLFQNNPMPMWVIDLGNFKFLDVNEMALLQYGYSRAEFLSMTALQIRPEEDRDAFLQSDHSYLTEKPNYNKGIWRHRKKDGSIIQVEIIGHEILFEGTKARLILSHDVTVQEQAIEKLAQNEKRFRMLVENNYDMISLVDESFKVIYRSPSVTRIMGCENKLGKNLEGMENVHPDDRPYAMEIIKQAATNPGKPINAVFRRQHNNGHYIWLEGVITNLLHDKDVQAYVTNFRDISERKIAEDNLIASELQFRSTLDNMLEGAQIIGFDWRYKYVNESFTKHSKYAKEELLGYTVMEKFPGIEEAEIFKVYQRCFNERASIHLENEFNFPDGSIGWFELSFQPVPEGIFILSIDITERKNAEAAILSAEANYREIFEKASDAIYVIEIETGQILEINQRATEITGYSKSELVNRDPELLSTGNPNYTRARSQAFVQKAASGEPQQFDWLIKKKDGEHSWLEINLTKANIAGEERILSFFREINDRKKAQLQIEKLNEELEQKVIIRTEQLKKSNEELEAFSYSISHDLRAPLRGIIGFTAILEEDYSSKLDDEARRITGIIKNNTAKMGNLIDDLLRFARLGRQSIIKTTVDFNEVINELITELGVKINNEKVNWTIPALPTAQADPITIKQVWINLITNAVKYSGKTEHPQIEIGSIRGNKENIFFIKDNGVGFDEKYREKLFKVFQRLHSATEFEGTGVGLAIVEKIISKHGGRVWAEAEPGKGACFYFSLPDE